MYCLRLFTLLLLLYAGAIQALDYVDSFGLENFQAEFANESGCQPLLDGIAPEDQSQKAIEARIDYFQCIEQVIAAKLTELDRRLAEDPEQLYQDISVKIGAAYQAFNQCKQDSNCKYHDTIQMFESQTNLFKQAILRAISGDRRPFSQRHPLRRNPWNAMPASETEQEGP